MGGSIGTTLGGGRRRPPPEPPVVPVEYDEPAPSRFDGWSIPLTIVGTVVVIVVFSVTLAHCFPGECTKRGGDVECGEVERRTPAGELARVHDCWCTVPKGGAR